MHVLRLLYLTTLYSTLIDRRSVFRVHIASRCYLYVACLVFFSWTSFPTDSWHFAFEDAESVCDIFHPHSYKRKLCSDGGLFMSVLLLSSPTILVLTTWTVLDYHSKHRLMLPHEQVYYDRCLSNHTALWLGMLLVYFFILLIAVHCSGLQNIQDKIQDTSEMQKATNIYAFLASFLTVMALLYWFFFRSLEININSVKSFRIHSLCGTYFCIYVVPIYPFHPKTLPSYCTTTEAQ